MYICPEALRFQDRKMPALSLMGTLRVQHILRAVALKVPFVHGEDAPQLLRHQIHLGEREIHIKFTTSLLLILEN